MSNRPKGRSRSGPQAKGTPPPDRPGAAVGSLHFPRTFLFVRGVRGAATN